MINDFDAAQAARALAEIELEEEKGVRDRIASAYSKLCGRAISSTKLTELISLYEEERDRFSKEPANAEAYVSIGQYLPEPGLKRDDLAATTLVINTIMNLDDFYMKR